MTQVYPESVVLPGGSCDTGEQEPLLVGVHVHDAWSLQPLPDPVTLFQGVDEHVLDSDVTTVGSLQPLQDLTQRQGLLLASDECGGRQFEIPIHIGFIYSKIQVC